MKAICTRWQWIGILAVVAMAFAGCAGDSVGTTFEVSEGEDGPGALLGGESGEEGGTKPGGGAPVIETESDTSSSSTEQDSTGVESDTEEEDAGTPGPFPGEFGYPCDGNEDCLSGFCVDSEQGKVCTEVCLENCPQGWECTQVSGLGGDVIYICVSKFANLCKPCTSSEQCNAGGLDGNACVDAGGAGLFCGVACEENLDCPTGYTCNDVVLESGAESKQCIVAEGECACTEVFIQEEASTTCTNSNEFGSCSGVRICGAMA